MGCLSSCRSVEGTQQLYCCSLPPWLPRVVSIAGLFLEPLEQGTVAAARPAAGSHRLLLSPASSSQVRGQMAERVGNRAINQKVAGSIPSREK